MSRGLLSRSVGHTGRQNFFTPGQGPVIEEGRVRGWLVSVSSSWKPTPAARSRSDAPMTTRLEHRRHSVAVVALDRFVRLPMSV